MIDFSDIVIELDEQEINDSIYRCHFPQYMHMIHSRKVSTEERMMVVTLKTYCSQVREVRESILRHASMYGFQSVNFIPGYTEMELSLTNDFVLVTCPRCREDYPLDLLSKS